MLAQNFMTAEALGLSEAEQRSLVDMLGRMERGEIPQDKFNMSVTGDHHWHVRTDSECGTPACICGWARHFSGGKVFPSYISGKGMWPTYPIGLRNLFRMCGDTTDGVVKNYTSIEEATVALRSYLTTGRPVWGSNQQ